MDGVFRRWVYHETAADRAREQAIADEVGPLWGREFKKNPVRYGLDYSVFETGPDRWRPLLGFAEIKDRTVGERPYSSQQIGRLGGYMIGLHKWCRGQELLKVTGLPWNLIIKLADGIFWRKSDKPELDLKIYWGGRSDRGSTQDQEPCVFIPMSSFTLLQPRAEAA